MPILITIRGQGDHDVEAEVAPRATVADLRLAVSAYVGRPVGSLTIDGRVQPDDADLSAVPLLRGTLVGTAPPGRPSAPRGAARVWLSVSSGEGSGRTVPVVADHVVAIGRASGCDLRIDDPSVSRRSHQARLVRTPTGPGVRLSDADGTQPPGRRSADLGTLGTGDAIRLGDTVLTTYETPSSPLSLPVRLSGIVEIHPPRSGLRIPPAPAPEADPPPVLTPAARHLPVGALVSAVASGLCWSLLMGARGLLLASVTAVALATAFGVDSLVRRVRRRRTERRHRETVAEHRSRRSTALRRYERLLRAHHPDPSELSRRARTGQVWQGDQSSGLHLRIGIHSTIATGADPAGREALRLVPVTVDLVAVDVLDVVGPTSRVSRLAAWLVLQAASALPPGALGIDVPNAAPDDPLWRWLRFLPHARAGSRPREDEIEAGRSETSPVLTVELPSADGRGDPGAVRVRLRQPEGGAAVGADAWRDRAPGSRVVVRCSSGRRPTGEIEGPAGPVPNATASEVILDLPDASVLDELARRLAPLRIAPAGGSEPLPDWHGMAHALVGGSPFDPDCIARQWARGPARPRAPMGSRYGATWVVDLTRDGPHAIVGGTTGSGKSELLRTLVVGLALASPPEALHLVLIDFKGGETFRQLEALPHVRNLATDLDQEWVDRAILALRSEIADRERAGGEGGATLPRLVIVVDEFATLRDAHPELMDTLVDVARRGRSLGVHLVLATQRPSGAVSREIRANVSLRLALRTADAAESADILGVAHAAAIPRREPGTTWVDNGREPLFVARVSPPDRPGPAVGSAGRHDPAATTRTPVVLRAAGTGTPGPGEGPPASRGPVGCMPELVTAIRDASEAGGHAPPGPLWSPALPTCLTVDELPAARQADGRRITVGLEETPDGRSHVVATLPLHPGHHLVIQGGPRSGRTTALRTIASQAAVLASGGRGREAAAIHVLDFRGDASDLSVGGGRYVGPDSPHLADMLLRELLARAPGQAAECLLLIDGWEVMQERHQGTPLPDLTLAVLRDGAARGITAVVTSASLGNDARLVSAAPERILLHVPQPAPPALSRPARRASPLPPGRGTRLPDGTRVQFAYTARRDRAADLTHEHSGSRPTSTAPGPPLPTAGEEAAGPPVFADGGRGSPQATLGVDLASGHTVRVALGRHLPGLLVAGSPGSGKTTTLSLLAQQAHGLGHVVRAIGPEAGGAVGSHPVDVVLVDDAHLWDDGAHPQLAEVIRQHAAQGAQVVAAADLDAVIRAFRRPLSDLRGSPGVLLLAPESPRAAQPWGVRLPVYDPWPPGRGALIEARRPRYVQVATP